MDDWEKFNETLLPEKVMYNDLCSHLNMKDITDAEYKHTETVVNISK